MNIVDVALVLMLLGAAASGYRRGLVVMVATMAGAVIGAIAGIRLAPRVAALVDGSALRIAIGIVVVLAAVGVGQMAGQWTGSRLAGLLAWRPVQAVDHGLGMIGQALAALVVAWLIALPLAALPLPWLSTQIRTSAVLSGVDEVMPPQAQQISARLRTLFAGSGLPQILAPLAPAPDTPTDPPDPALALDPEITALQDSIPKIRAESRSCSQAMEGSGFVVAPGRVVTNAHVVAGSSSVTVETAEGSLAATVVSYDAQTDIAVLQVPGFMAPALPLATEPAESGDDLVAAGYPLDGPFTVTPMRLRATIRLAGQDIYATDTVTREVYTLRGMVRPGNSGGPLLSPDGTVVGVIFGAAIDKPDVGFALTMKQAMVPIVAGMTGRTAVDTGACVAH